MFVKQWIVLGKFLISFVRICICIDILCMLLYIMWYNIVWLFWMSKTGFYLPDIDTHTKKRTRNYKISSTNITGSRLENCFGLPCVAWFTMYTSMMSVCLSVTHFWSLSHRCRLMSFGYVIEKFSGLWKLFSKGQKVKRFGR